MVDHCFKDFTTETIDIVFVLEANLTLDHLGLRLLKASKEFLSGLGFSQGISRLIDGPKPKGRVLPSAQ